MTAAPYSRGLGQSVKGTLPWRLCSQQGCNSLVRTWTTDLKDRHIRSNVVSPGPIKRRLQTGSADLIARIVSTVPWDAWVTDEVAKAALYLASDDRFRARVELLSMGAGQSAISLVAIAA